VTDSDHASAANAESGCRAISASDVIWSSNAIAASRAKRALLFESRGALFALLANSVSEVIEASDTTEVPGSPVWFKGVSIYRSQPAPLIDVAKFLLPESPPLAFNRAIAVRIASSTYLLAVDKILSLCNLPSGLETSGIETKAGTIRDNQLHSEPHGADGPVQHRAISGTCRYDNRELALIDLPELLRCTKLLRECAIA